jgi:Zn-dependent M32 family carboxypeptidase
MQNQNSKIEETLSKLMEMVKESNQQNQQYQRSHDAVLRNFETQLQQNQRYQIASEAATRNLETQLGQLAKQIGNNNNQGGTFTANTEPIPKDCKSIKTRSGIEIGKGIGDNLEKERTVVEAREKGKEKIEGSECEAENKKEGLVEKEKKSKK